MVTAGFTLVAQRVLRVTCIVRWVRFSLLHVVLHSIAHVRRRDDDCVALRVVRNTLQLAELSGTCKSRWKEIRQSVKVKPSNLIRDRAR